MAISLLFLRALKVGFGVSFIATMAAVVTLTLDWKRQPVVGDDGESGLFLDPFPASSRSEELDENYPNCVRNPTKEFCLLTADQQLVFFRDEARELQSNSISNRESSEFRRRHPVESIISDFNDLMQVLDIEAVLIEPTILFCALSAHRKQMLQRRGFDLAAVVGAQNVVHFALLKGNWTRLEDTDETIHSSGFAHIGVRDDDAGEEVFDHHFFSRRLILVHAVVFRQKGHFLWHRGLRTLPDEVARLVDADKLLFSATDSSYEKFEPMLLETNDVRTFGLKVPSRPSEFLHQIASSRLLQCAPLKPSPPGSSPDRMEVGRLFVTALSHLKEVFNPLLLDFWIFQQTAADWFYHCNSTYYTTSISFATWRTEDVNNYFENLEEGICRIDKNTREAGIREPYEWTFNCLGHKVKLLFLFKAKTAAWHLRYKENIVVKFKYPKIELCSADVYGQKVTIPCSFEALSGTQVPQLGVDA